MIRNRSLLALLAGLLLVVASMTLGTATTSAHALYDRSDPPAGAMVDPAPFVLRAWFTEELLSRSSIVVLDQLGIQVDNLDGQVDLDDPDRKLMLVSLPALPAGVYTVVWTSISAEDGEDAFGTFYLGGGVTPPTPY